MADYCNARSNGGCGSTSMGTFRPGPPTSLAGYHHSTLTRTAKIGGNLTAAEVKDRMGTIDGGQRVRIVRLARPQSYAHGHFNGGGSFGFSIRGGLEYGTGFFVSAVEKDSEADRQGLRVGDQIIRVNGYHVDDAVHREVAQFVSCQERLVLKVRSVGILPVKERSSDPLTWHVVSVTINSGPTSGNGHPSTNGSSTKKHQHRAELERTSCSSSNSSTSTASSGTLEELPGGRDLKVILSVAPRTKLGCGICKGPDWKPGIFVQFTKDGGVAREAGLRPGDQILSCNGRQFADITFAEAVSIMKASQVLELVVRPGAGIDMFPGESSGYNSSASSVNGDQSPCWGDSTAKRLSIVREESISKDRRLAQQKMAPKTAVNGHRRNNTTIIEFSENGTVVNSTLISGDGAGKKELTDKDGSKKLADICFVSKQSETKTVIVEVHRSASTNSIAVGSNPSTSSGGKSTVSSGSTSNIPPPPPLFADKIPPPPPPSSGLSSGYSTTNSAKSGGLGAIGGQQQQRSLSSVSLADSSASSGIDCGSTGGGIGGLGNAISEELKRRAEKKGTLMSSAAEPAAALTELENRLKEKRFRPPNAGSDAARHTALMDEFRVVHKRMFKNGFDNAELKKSSSKDKLPIEVRPPGATTTAINQDPPASSSGGGSQSKGTMGRVAASELAKANGDTAELESIESFQMINPQPAAVRPPSYYFCPQNSGPATMKKSQKPIAVTISEYIGGGGGGGGGPEQPKMQPTRIDFGVGAGGGGDSIGSLKYELEKTLSLSNLRQRSESREDLVERIQIGCGQQEQGGKLSRSSSVANVVGRSGSSATSVSSGNRITIAISNGAGKK